MEARGQNPTAPAVAWTEVASNAGQSVFYPTTAVGLANGTVLKFVGHVGDLRKYTVTSPTSPSGWLPAPVTVLAVTVLALAAVRVPNTNGIRLWYINSSNNVLYIDSLDDGATWSAPATAYSGGAAVLDLVVAYINNGTTLNAPWFFGFTTQAAGVYTPRFGYYDGAAWVTHAYDANWRAAGIDAYGTVATSHRVLVMRQRDVGATKLRVVTKAAAVYSSPKDLDHTQAGLFGLELAYYRFCQLPEANCMLAVAGESAYGAGIVLGVGGIFSATETLVDEPVMLPDVAGVSSQPYASLCSVGTDLYLVGDIVAYRGAAQAATATTLEPVRYVYDDHTLEIEFKAGSAALAVGQILVVTRTLSWGTQTGSEAFRAIIVRVEQGTDKVLVVALDALGWLGTARCRRPSILNDGTATGVATVMRKLAARFGLAVGNDRSALETATVMPFTLAPAESLSGARFRVGSQSEFYLVPANDGSFALTMITPGTSDSGDYSAAAQAYGASPSQQPIARAAAVSDYRVLAFAYVLGTYSTDPDDGAAVAMEQGPVIDNTRPLSYSLTNSRYNTTARVAAAATAEAARQRKLPVTGIVEGQANLALEVYDVVAVTEPLLGWVARTFRVRRIVEQWERARLTQTVYLGEV